MLAGGGSLRLTQLTEQALCLVGAQVLLLEHVPCTHEKQNACKSRAQYCVRNLAADHASEVDGWNGTQEQCAE